MGCVRSQSEKEETKTRCDRCLVGKLSLKLVRFDLHSLRMDLERIQDLKLNLEYGNQKLEGIQLWKLENQPELFQHVIAIHGCCQQYDRALMVTIQNTKTKHNAFGFINLDKYINSRSQEEQVICCMNYQLSSAGKLVFQATFQELHDYEEFVFQICQASIRFMSDCLNYRVKILIGEDIATVDGLQLEDKQIKWHYKVVKMKVPLELVTEGRVDLFSVRQGKQIEKLGELYFSLSAFKDPHNIVNNVNEKATVSDCFIRKKYNEKGQIIGKEETGDLLMFIVKKSQLNFLQDEALTPMLNRKAIKKRHLLQKSESCVSLKKITLNIDEDSSGILANTERHLQRQPSISFSRRRQVSMPPLEIYKIIRKASIRKPQFKQY